MHLEHLLSFPHCVSPMRIMVNNHSYFPIFGHCGWNVPRQVVLCSFCFVFGIFVVCFFFILFVCLVFSVLFLLNGCLNNGMMVIYHSAKFTCFLKVLFWANLAKCICSSTWRYKIFLVAIRNGKGSSKSACKRAFGIGTSFEAITGQLDVLSRSHYSVFYVSWSFKMQLFENIWKDLQFFC